MAAIVAAAIAWAGVSGERAEARIAKVFVVPLSHLDIGFTAPPDEVARQHREHLDLMLDLMERLPGLRWQVESVWQLEAWATGGERSEADLGRLRAAVRDGRLALGAGYANFHTSLMTAEEMLRSFYPGVAAARWLAVGTGGEVRVRRGVAFLNDVPGAAWYWAQALANAGVTRLVVGANTAFGGGFTPGPGDVPFYWVAPDGSRVLVWYTPLSYIEGTQHWQLHRSYPALAARLAELEAAGYPYDAVLILDATGDNAPPEASVARQLAWAEPWGEDAVEVRYATADEFFDYMEARYGETFPTLRGDWGRTWEVVRVAGPWQMNRMRMAQRELPALEALATGLHLTVGTPYPRQALQEAWRQLIVLGEHTAGPSTGWPGLTTQADVDEENRQKAAYLANLHARLAEIRGVVARGLVDYAQRFAGDPGVAAGIGQPGTLLVYDPAGSRSVTVTLGRADLVALCAGPGVGTASSVVDLRDGRTVPATIGEEGLTFLVSDLRPGELRAYRVVCGSTGTAGVPAVETPLRAAADAPVVLQSPWYTVRIDPRSGLVTSLRDEQLGRELVAGGGPGGVAGGFGQLVQASHEEAQADGEGAPVQARVERVERIDRPWEQALRIVYAPEGPLAELTVRLPSYARRVELTYTLRRDGVPPVPYEQHSTHYFVRLPFAIDAAQLRVRYEGAAGFHSVEDVLPGANARSLIVHDALALWEGDEWGVVLAPREAFAFTVGSISHLGTATTPGSATLFSRVWQQQDEGLTREGKVVRFDVEPTAPPRLTFTYALGSFAGPWDPVAATAWAEAFQAPLLVVSGDAQGVAWPGGPAVTLEPAAAPAAGRAPSSGADGGGPVPGVATTQMGGTADADEVGACGSLRPTVDRANVRVQAFKLADFGDPGDVIVRLQETAGVDTTVRLRLPFPARAVVEATATEEPRGRALDPQAPEVHVPAFGTVTLRVIVVQGRCINETGGAGQ